MSCTQQEQEVLLIEETSNLPVHKYLAGHLGGEQAVRFSDCVNNDIDLVIFLR